MCLVLRSILIMKYTNRSEDKVQYLNTIHNRISTQQDPNNSKNSHQLGDKAE